MVLLLYVVQRVIEVGVFLKVEGCALNQFDEHYDVVVAPRLLEAWEGLNLASH